MPLKRIHTEAEIETLADTFRPLWRQGDVLRPWLRQHYGTLLDLVHGDWSWTAIARAMTRAGITYRTGKSWNADWLQSEVYRACRPLKGYRRQKQTARLSPPAPSAPLAPAALAPMENAAPAFSALTDETEFQPARFIDWETKRSEADALPPAEPTKPIIQPPPSTYDEVMARLLGKKPPP